MKKTKYIILILLFCLLTASFNVAAAEETEITLTQAVKILMENNRQLINSRQNIEKAQKDVELSGRGYYPTANLQTSYTKLESGQQTIDFQQLSDPSYNFFQDGFPMTETPDQNYSTSLSLSQPLYLGGRVRIGKDISKLGLEMSKIEYQKQLDQSIFNLVQAYYGVLQAQGMVEIRENALEVVNEHLRIVKVNNEAGMSLRQDLLQTQIEQRKAEEDLIAAENQLQIAKKRLAQLLGDSSVMYQVSTPQKNPEPATELDKLINLALENRAELKSLSVNQKMLEKQKDLEGNPYRPQISLNGSYSWQGSELEFSDGSWNVTVAGSISLYDGGKANLNEEKKKIEVNNLDNSTKDLKESIRIEIEDTLLSLQHSEEMIKLEKLSLENAEENLELTNKSYQAGINTNIDVINAQTSYKQAQIALLQAEYDYEKNLYKLFYNTGRIKELFKDVI
ncbi:TolC family protein [Halanaerobium kushneri]|uniref:Outer membrane protein TolC n=1 Tax=Halanaerobium kushneri TaxID=56779 RepID=A0A1N6U6X5_9FIRM|nr:TolC family protein [Halanaerobium kushneri]SIQ61385.1 Outer membrane protein TolC [Halanaerobium kushneri]